VGRDAARPRKDRESAFTRSKPQEQDGAGPRCGDSCQRTSMCGLARMAYCLTPTIVSSPRGSRRAIWAYATTASYDAPARHARLHRTWFIPRAPIDPFVTATDLVGPDSRERIRTRKRSPPARIDHVGAGSFGRIRCVLRADFAGRERTPGSAMPSRRVGVQDLGYAERGTGNRTRYGPMCCTGLFG